MASNKPSMAEIAKRLQQRKDSIESKVRKFRNPGMAAGARKKSMEWFFTLIKASADDYKKGEFSIAQHPFIGGMFHFIYDAKHKDKLPYWDKFPLVIPIEKYPDGFLGLNLHYLSPILRAKLLDLLINNYKRISSSKVYMKVSYAQLKALSSAKMFEPCVHRYLSAHMRSKAVMVTADLWEEVAFLPTQQFVGAKHAQVWEDSKKRI